uniref:Uncharacterized protein n=1 Tax=Candidatus Kentrum sp. TUN TaxID=2126343 RepID=A0A451A5G7_9GAMM|nr:MAG: hypothetical protein BECKTUN1418D_GA0071000_11486 [Candidatus Kentron sp. TUN]
MDSSRFMGSLNALHQHAAIGPPMPKFPWEFSMGDSDLLLHVHSDLPPRVMRTWIATAPTCDFRKAHWEAFPMGHNEKQGVYKLAVPSTGFAAMFGEAEYFIYFPLGFTNVSNFKSVVLIQDHVLLV